MRILIFGINYAPELTGIGKYTGEMGAWLAAQGHEVSVVTALPYYPEWEVHPAYKGKRWMREELDGATVYRVPLYVPKVVRARNRMIHEFSFELAIFPVWFRLLLKQKFDVVINVTPPFHLGFYALMYAKLKGAKLITHIQDLQVDAAHELGMIRSKKLIGFMFAFERYLLKKSDLVSSISLGMLKKIYAKGIKPEKCLLFPNWVDGKNVQPLPVQDSLRKDWGIPLSDQVVLYSGNLGKKQGLELILSCAAHFRDNKHLHFVIVGSGGMKEELMARAKCEQLGNVHFYALQPYDKLSALLATADIHLVLQKKSASDLVMPSKLTAILAAGGFALVNAVPGTTLYQVMDKYQLGILVEPESVAALNAGIEQALAMDRSTMQEAARRYALKYLDKEQILHDFEERLKEIL
ncbi:WcaI family glycosyltransferase [Olivibacter sitiensis]|uniref:WcaI family glycosyltransferase n=1 Tax=Olivibacter sitiensis TaxID=376470 RepID=UPI00041C47CA|nr:WcaI family glycosyltransferase [Olivibacter sitiensis]